MLFTLPDTDTLYEALTNKDPKFDGRAYVGVITTGIFCRLTCSARKPKRENCRFFETIGQCLEAGFRPCKRCQPLMKQDPIIRTLTEALQANPDRHWREADIVALGYDLSTVRRAFKRDFGITFLEMSRLTRLRQGFESLGAGERVIDAQLDAGFMSANGFRDAFARLLGAPPFKFRSNESALLRADWIETKLGPMLAIADKHNLHLLEFLDRKSLPNEVRKLNRVVKGALEIGRFQPIDQIETELDHYFSGVSARFDTPVVFHGSDFTQRVWHELQKIRPGETRSYSDIAVSLGKPTATRAVAKANGANQLAIIVPCHRVLGADGSLTGYGGGLWRKETLIELERTYARQRKSK